MEAFTCCGSRGASPKSDFDTEPMLEDDDSPKYDDDESPRQSGGITSHPAVRGCCKCCGVCVALVLGVFLFSAIMSLIPGECEYARRSFHVDTILPANAAKANVSQPLEIGTASNMSVDSELDIDLTGLWWMDGNPLPEYLVSWVGSTASAPFPSRMSTPNSMAGRWAWSDSVYAHLIKTYYAFSTSASTPLDSNWENSSYAAIIPVTEELGDVFHFYKIDADTWDRRPSYTLRRVVLASGEPHPENWQKFVDFLETKQPDKTLIAWASNNDCHRLCQSFFSCRFCSLFC